MILLNYPRPDFRRKNWIDLTGKWLFHFDYKERLTFENAKDLDMYTNEINVPYPYQSTLSGIGVDVECDVIWYACQFSVSPLHLKSYKTFLIKFGAVDYESHVWLNGKYLGKHIGGYDPFSFNISDIVENENTLILKVIDRHGDQPRGKQAKRGEKPSGIIYTKVTGIWQPVWLEMIKEKTYIENYQIIIESSKSFILRVQMGGKMKEDLSLEVSITSGGASIEQRVIRLKQMIVEEKIELEDPILWSPDDPHLYDLKLTLKHDEEILDEVEGYFGLREISIKGDKILFNGKPIYLQMVLDQGYYLDGIYTPKRVEDFLSDLKNVIEMGFNGVRAHQKPPDPRYLYIADSLGVLVWEEMADWGMSLKKENLEIFLSQWRNIIKRDFNHPSVITWVPFNERIEPTKSEEARKFILTVFEETKKLDPTRPVIDSSGWTHVKTDIMDIHDYLYCMNTGREYSEILNYEELWKPIIEGTELIEIGSEPFRISIPGTYKKQPIVISEFGGWGIEGQKPVIDRKPYVYAKLYDSFRLQAKFEEIVKAIALASHISGYCYTQLYDVEGELNGLLTYNRKWKVDPQKIRKANNEALRIWKEKVME
ncbi:MAG: glycoside hydrolase family 2 TIM barrel-domain containing protein [Candidatus Asgardarchaeum sp.]